MDIIEKFSCPSAPLHESSKLLGIVNQEGEVAILPQPLAVDENFIENALEGRTPEKRFRFTNKCVKSACQQWNGDSCGVIKTVLEKIEEQYWKTELPACGIRDTCRWFFQEGGNACKVCPLVRYSYAE
jgi:hypothetical protein